MPRIQPDELVLVRLRSHYPEYISDHSHWHLYSQPITSTQRPLVDNLLSTAADDTAFSSGTVLNVVFTGNDLAITSDVRGEATSGT